MWGETIWKDQCSKSHLVVVRTHLRVTQTSTFPDYGTYLSFRMISLKFLSLFVIFLIFVQTNLAVDNEEIKDLLTESQVEQIQSPMLEVLMHLPNKFKNVQSFKNTLGLKSERVKRKTVLNGSKNDAKFKKIVDVRSFEITRPDSIQPQNFSKFKIKRSKRDVETKSETTQRVLEKPEGLVSQTQGTLLPIPDALRGPVYSTFPVKEFDIVDIDDPDDPRRRRNESSDNQDDNSQRDKRTFMEAAENGESTTSLPFWKRKKENPPFITGRGSSVQKANTYTPPQHRSIENARESHSLKNIDKTVQSNEISRNNQQDNYYSATNRRAYARQSDNIPQSTPKSVYDTIDFNNNNKRNQDQPKTDFGRTFEEKKEPIRENRVTHEQYNRQFFYNHPSVYDRSFYQPPYPYPTQVVGKGVEYYHRTYDPSTGRIIYYANMPEHGRSFEYRFADPINRNFYVNRPYFYDPYYRNYVPPFDYRFSMGYGRTFDYMRSGRSNSQAYSYPFPEREKFPRDARFTGGFDKSNRLREDLRNKTYIIYDAEESRSQYPRTQYPSDGNRVNSYIPPQNNFPVPPQVPVRNLPFPQPVDYFPPPNIPLRNQFYPTSPGAVWGFNHRSNPGVTNSELNSRPLHSREVQLPLTASNRALHPTGETDKNKKS